MIKKRIYNLGLEMLKHIQFIFLSLVYFHIIHFSFSYVVNKWLFFVYWQATDSCHVNGQLKPSLLCLMCRDPV